MAKKIPISDELAIEFVQRARGNETPFWEGKIHQLSGKQYREIGTFFEGGNGGGASISPHPVNQILATMVKQATTCDYKFQVDAESVLYWAELIGYNLRCTWKEFTLTDYLDIEWGRPSQIRDLSADVIQRHEKAQQKAEKIKMIQSAQKAAKKGHTIVMVGDEFYEFRTRDQSVITNAVKKQHGADAKCECLA